MNMIEPYRQKVRRAVIAWMLVAALVLSGDLLAGEVRFPPILEAAHVAQQDLSSKLREFPAETEYDKYVENVDNYAIGLSAAGNNFVVVFRLRPREKGEVIKGGVAIYKVRRTDLTIVDFAWQE